MKIPALLVAAKFTTGYVINAKMDSLIMIVVRIAVAALIRRIMCRVIFAGARAIFFGALPVERI